MTSSATSTWHNDVTAARGAAAAGREPAAPASTAARVRHDKTNETSFTTRQARATDTVQQHRVTGRYLKQYAIQANPTNTDSTTASNNITMFIVLILFPSCSPAREGALVRRRRPRACHARSEQCSYTYV